MLKRWARPIWHALRRAVHRAPTVVARALSPVVALEDAVWFPPRGEAASTPDWCRSATKAGRPATPRCEIVEAEHRLDRPPPKTVEADLHVHFQRRLIATIPAAFVAEIPDGYVWGPRGAVLTSDRHLLADVSAELPPRAGHSHSVFREWRRRPLRQFDGAVAVASGDGFDMYYHWMFHLLPRIGLLRRSGMYDPDACRLLVSSTRRRF